MATERTLLQQLAIHRLDEAKLLLREREPSGAYYLAGYAIECALKALIAAQFREHEIPDKSLIDKIYTHNLPALLGLTGIAEPFEAAREADPELDRKWSIVKSWSEQARYSVWTEAQALAMIRAIDGDDKIEGVFQWLSAHW
jgi:HEPN domain-containing protein